MAQSRRVRELAVQLWGSQGLIRPSPGTGANTPQCEAAELQAAASPLQPPSAS